MPHLTHDRYDAQLQAETARFAAAVRDADPAHPVPTCPAWTLAQLTEHVGFGHRWAAVMGRRPDRRVLATPHHPRHPGPPPRRRARRRPPGHPRPRHGRRQRLRPAGDVLDPPPHRPLPRALPAARPRPDPPLPRHRPRPGRGRRMAGPPHPVRGRVGAPTRHDRRHPARTRTGPAAGPEPPSPTGQLPARSLRRPRPARPLAGAQPPGTRPTRPRFAPPRPRRLTAAPGGRWARRGPPSPGGPGATGATAPPGPAR
jgi:hypothetical protein